MSLKNAVHTGLATVALMLTASMPGHAEQMRAIHFSGSWQGGAYSNDQTKKFSHCTGGATYRSGIMLMVTINRQYNWGLGFVDQNWNLTVGQNIPVSVTFDNGAPWNGTALVITKNMVTIPMAENSVLINAFRAAFQMRVTASGQNFFFNLDGTSRLMPELAYCVRTELALERGEPAPAFAASPSAPARSMAPTPAQHTPVDSSLELAATRIATNLLLKAELPNARLLTAAETPASIRGLGVAWKSDVGTGAVELLPSTAGKDAQGVAASLISSDSTTCKGDFASGRSSELVDDTIVTKAFTGCKDSDGSRAIRYFVVHHDGGPYVVYAIAATGTADPASSTPKISDPKFQSAAVKAAFSQ